MAVGPPLNVDSAGRILDYDAAVFARFLTRVRRLPNAEACAEREIGHHTLFGTMVHILHVREAWLQFVITDGGKNEDAFFNRPERTPTDWKGFDSYAARVWASHAAFRRSLTARRLAAPAKAWWMKGRYTVADAILQVSYEEAHHLGEIIGALWQKDLASPSMTWIEVNRPPARSAKRKGRPTA
jgi:uncharacterized damage-inducible protein DinB